MKSHFFAYISRMRFIQRWALMRNTAPENVQEHSHQVAVLAHALAVICNEKFGGRLDPGAVAVAALYHFAWLVAGNSHAVESLRVPFAYRHTVVVIVGTHKDEDGIEIITMFLLQLVCLTGNIVPLSAAHTINVRGDAEPILQESPVSYF